MLAQFNMALNISREGYPLPSASVNASPDTSLYQAIDGKCWYFSEITNRWTTLGSTSNTNWFAVDFGKPCKISGANIYPIADGKSFSVPDSLAIEYHHAGKWLPVNIRASRPVKITGNTKNTIDFERITADKMRITFKHNLKQVAISEIEFY